MNDRGMVADLTAGGETALLFIKSTIRCAPHYDNRFGDAIVRPGIVAETYLADRARSKQRRA
jgi:hypothetical protein